MRAWGTLGFVKALCAGAREEAKRGTNGQQAGEGRWR